jgi:hypothetical protein
MLLKLKLLGVTSALLVAAIWAGIPVPTTSACDEWAGGGLDDGPYQSLFSVGAPLHGRGDINRAAARVLLEAWTAAGQPADFDATPYTTYGPDCEGGINQINNVGPNGGAVAPQLLPGAQPPPAAEATPDNDNDNTDDNRDENDNQNEND